MSTPEWLTASYLKQALCNYHKVSEINIIDFEKRSAIGKGENYGAELTRLQVKYQLVHDEELQIKYLIAKTALVNENEKTKQLKAPYDVFNREMSIYEQVIPKLNALLVESGEDSEQLFPDVLYVDKQNEAIIFEDLSVRGYELADRLKCLDEAHIKLILRKLAKMHAASAVLNERERGYLESYDRGFFNKYTESYRTYFIGCLLACARYISQQPDLKQYAEKLFALEPHYMQIGLNCFTPIESHLNVLTHGDLWTNNVMFKYDSHSGQPIDVLLIDFQYTFWGAPTLDLHHLFNTSMIVELRRHQEASLLQYYHEIFTKMLKKLNYRQKAIPSLHQLHMQYEEKAFYAVHCGLILQAVLINDDPTDADFEAFLSLDERGINFKNRLYKNPTIQKNLKWLIPKLDQRGLLDTDQCGTVEEIIHKK